MAKVVMILQGLPTGQKTGYEGCYLKDFDFEVNGGTGELLIAKDINEAKVFSSMAEALKFYHTIPKCRALRPDGKPNKPLTATNWEFQQCNL